jgi:hypothetical protein
VFLLETVFAAATVLQHSVFAFSSDQRFFYCVVAFGALNILFTILNIYCFRYLGTLLLIVVSSYRSSVLFSLFLRMWLFHLGMLFALLFDY